MMISLPWLHREGHVDCTIAQAGTATHPTHPKPQCSSEQGDTLICPRSSRVLNKTDPAVSFPQCAAVAALDGVGPTTSRKT